MNNQNLDTLTSAYGERFKFHDENLVMLGWYARRIIQIIESKSLRSVLSLGIGHQVLPKAIIDGLGTRLARYTIIEGSRDIIEAFRSKVTVPANTELIHSFFEEYRPPEKFDAIEMGFVLEHVNDPAAIVSQYSQFLAPGGTLFIAVPNAKSLHRLIGHEAGLLDNVFRLSPEDLQLGHQRYFDHTSLCKLVLAAGLKIVNVEGVLLKPLASGQLRSLNLSPTVVEALLKVGVHFPEICNSILVEARL
jgi:2-polyprenyl-3-methyl-5-hydroxy-6-metoxy-1,4-benzoquinol methylase